MKTLFGGNATAQILFTKTGLIIAAMILAACSQAGADSPSNYYEELQPVEPAAAVEPVLAAEAEVPAAAANGKVDASAMVAEHNKWRSQVGVPGLVWSDKLADVAQGWADTLKNNSCGFYHSGNGYGENLYMASPLMWSDGRKELQNKTPQEVTDSWGDEIKSYDYASNSCSGVCGHYTQVVWKDTKEVGCAMAVCGDNAQIWVCSYAPAGNVVGQRPY